ncbi:hypothetical protein GJS40_03270 [Aliibacillus thermotolerans]|nr:hypothetical protein [Aliibacillus thermotolerans]
MLVTVIATIVSLINYGFGLVVGALMAIQIAKRVPSVDYRLLVATSSEVLAFSVFIMTY